MSKKKKRRSGAKKKPAAQPLLPLWKLLVQQLLLTGLVLCVFALFHHVLPRAQESLDIAVERPAAQTAAEEKSVPAASARFCQERPP